MVATRPIFLIKLNSYARVASQFRWDYYHCKSRKITVFATFCCFRALLAVWITTK